METKKNDIKKGYKQLTTDKIKQFLIGRTFEGEYVNIFKYIISINNNGTLEGKNDKGHYDKGLWEIDKINNSLKVSWQLGWDSNNTYILYLNGRVKMYDIKTGEHISTFKERNQINNIKNYNF